MTPYLGWLNAYAFLTEDKQDNPDYGPIGWVNQSVNDGAFTCSIQNASGWLLNRKNQTANLLNSEAAISPRV